MSRKTLENEDQYAAYTITKLLHTINPLIDQEAAYDLVFDYIVAADQDLSPERAVELGRLILAASATAEGEEQLH